MPSPPPVSVNAWIFPSEDEPANTGYASPESCYQALIRYGVYTATDTVNICFHNTVPTGSDTVPTGDGSTYTIQVQEASHPNGVSNLQYMEWIIRDAKATNPNVRLLATLGYGADEFTQIFGTDPNQWPQNADDYASNLVAYLDHYGLDGFDIDWESPLSGRSYPPDETYTKQVALILRAIRAAYTAQGKAYLLTLSPAVADNLDASAVNDAVDYLNLQVYSGFTDPSAFTGIGIAQELLAYGAKFESRGNGILAPYQDAQDAYTHYTGGGYTVATQWRLNSGDYQFEQAQQRILHQLIHGLGDRFDDTDTAGAAGNPPITRIDVRHGDVLNALQPTSTGSFSSNGDTVPLTYTMPQHGGDGGTLSTVTLAEGDRITEVSGYTGDWFGRTTVLQLTITTQNGQTFGPFGTMNYAANPTPFSYPAPSGQSIVAFKGTTQVVPMAGGSASAIVTSLDVSFG